MAGTQFAASAGKRVPATISYIFAPDSFASPGFHLFGGATILCAFFIATDPVSAATSTRGRMIYGLGIGFLIFCVRQWGSYADGVAFAVLMMNMAVPAIDYLTRPHIIGHDESAERGGARGCPPNMDERRNARNDRCFLHRACGIHVATYRGAHRSE